ncbi:MAG: hypothetical protein AVDCRST_MAG67-2216 [uncultured Solirubrobacteraceae bacterium]|uniref:Uncharacterized protein n=1 Tax=uncultured Solirubrobacteraceae bacterium TaxID=1162706 RepID=A0A6J4SSP8_9ACTN|nr:MAG: hypothetical protein AVDCRST_MAG67-2216 [uncultured Solirubrobacteraceae bacterium]
MTQPGQTQGAEFDLGFHAIMHFGDDVALETHPAAHRRDDERLTAGCDRAESDGDDANANTVNAPSSPNAGPRIEAPAAGMSC